jgi:protein phosphatase
LAVEAVHSARTDIGLKRQHNEDRYLADPSLGLFVVCDGMGGGNAGEVASAMAIETIRTYVQSVEQAVAPPVEAADGNVSPATTRLAEAVRAANGAIHRASWMIPSHAGMGTTVVAVQLVSDVLSVAHVGDSRLYLIRHGRIEALTADHSWVAEQVQQGLMTEAEAERSPKRNIVTRALGVESTVDVDIAEIPVFPGDRLLLCSDGLTRGIRPPDILQAIDSSPNPDTVADRLIAMANSAGGEDNTTVLLVTIQRAKTGGLWQRVLQNWYPKAS